MGLILPLFACGSPLDQVLCEAQGCVHTIPVHTVHGLIQPVCHQLPTSSMDVIKFELDGKAFPARQQVPEARERDGTFRKL